MINRTRTLIVTAAFVVAAGAAAALAHGGQAHGASGSVLVLKISASRISTVDVPPLITSKTSPESPGDEVISVSKVGGSATGHRYLFCTNTGTARSIEVALYDCHVTYVLGNSTVTADGVIRLTGDATAAITGGTGAYAGARGTLRSTPANDTLTLLP